MYIGELARRTGVTRKAIRHYESLGILPEPKRKGSYRVYDQDDEKLLCVITEAQKLGFSLREIREISTTQNCSRMLPVDKVLQMIESKRAELRTAIADAQRLDRDLAALTDRLGSMHETTDAEYPVDSSPRGKV
ncbi:MerR family transcriptional regulator [Pseudooceanicola sp.]|uniref:MerR family transcriptional regulator n=1 Tax=Pseudooceanicola sp. TaxID=1914328 RepID=UPI0035C74345